MAKVFTSWGALESALQKEVSDATEEVIDNSIDTLFKNVDMFYSSEEGRYIRQGHLAASPESEFLHTIIPLRKRYLLQGNPVMHGKKAIVLYRIT